jgi:hypothetical protein
MQPTRAEILRAAAAWQGQSSTLQCEDRSVRMRDWLIGPSWKSATVVSAVPDRAQFVGYDLNGWAYYRVLKNLFAVKN